VSDSGTKPGVDSDNWGYRLGRWWRRHPRGRWVAVGAVVLLFAAVLATLGTPDKPSNTIAMPASSSDLEGGNYQDVKTKLQVAGFTSIETSAVPDLIVGLLHQDGDVKEVSVNGETDFDADSTFPRGARIIIRYHTFPAPESDTAAESSSPPVPAEIPVEPTPQAQGSSNLAKRTEKATLSAFGVHSFTDLFKEKGSGDSLFPFISGFEDHAAGWVVVTVQVTRNETTKEELKQTASAILSLTGEQLKDLNGVEVDTADGELFGMSTRAEVPMLNQ